jgi:hypothetical protein
MGVEFRINEDTQFLIRAGTGYGRLTMFITEDQCISFP